ncbi:LysM peptidoglycan-binding domain-containing protein [Singulisphaera acidiphila]|uniref:LysM domain-containing protein n=1 Tax=Singulisphaera acidiphila (strain ATCC BAA-1392 / DSM 18658 / VKM B-2454 / MOB10) TaxID=886293 RepID=L0DGR7_SINAD|nr:LysM peptidoglycan-binding domain-containing protein [Singulisphaera acidiphila]AGA28574.1 hypothetical protein Sinac_4382 [Singulisphaera acidiphila DSM 18658]
MNRHVGASFTLSVLVVVFFAVILYEPDHTRSRVPASEPEPVEASPTPPPPTPGVPLIESTANLLPEPSPTLAASPSSSRPIEAVVSLAPVPPPKPPAPSPRARVPAPDPRAVVQVVSRRQPPSPPPPPGRHSAFTQVAEGESLSDVALRVYGTSEATTSLWRANRDIIARRETPLAPGLVLRTP